MTKQRKNKVLNVSLASILTLSLLAPLDDSVYASETDDWVDGNQQVGGEDTSVDNGTVEFPDWYDKDAIYSSNGTLIYTGEEANHYRGMLSAVLASPNNYILHNGGVYEYFYEVDADGYAINESMGGEVLPSQFIGYEVSISDIRTVGANIPPSKPEGNPGGEVVDPDEDDTVELPTEPETDYEEGGDTGFDDEDTQIGDIDDNEDNFGTLDPDEEVTVPEEGDDGDYEIPVEPEPEPEPTPEPEVEPELDEENNWEQEIPEDESSQVEPTPSPDDEPGEDDSDELPSEEADPSYVNNFKLVDLDTGREYTKFTILGQNYTQRLNDRIEALNIERNVTMEINNEEVTSKSISTSTINGNSISTTTSEITVYVINESLNDFDQEGPSLIPNGTIYDDINIENAYRKINIYNGTDLIQSQAFIYNESIDDSIKSAIYQLDQSNPGVYYYDNVSVSRGLTSIMTNTGIFRGTLLAIDIFVNERDSEEITPEPTEPETDDNGEVPEETPTPEPTEPETGDNGESSEETATPEPTEPETSDNGEVSDDDSNDEALEETPTPEAGEDATQSSESDDNLSTLIDERTGISVSSEYDELEGLQLRVQVLNASDRISNPHDRYDIELVDADGNFYELQNSVTVSIPVNGEVSNVYYLGESLTDLPYELIEGNVIFNVDSFSEYVVTYKENTDNVNSAAVNNNDSGQTNIDNENITDSNSSTVKEENITGDDKEMLPDTGVSASNIILPVALLALLGGTILYFTRRKTN